MARIRNVKPAYFQHERIYEAEASSGLPLRLAYIGLWTQADRRGLFRWRHRTLKVNILPYDGVDFGAVLDALAKAGFIERYEVDGEAYGRIPTFAKHQRPHVREGADPDIPPPTNGSGTTKAVPEHNQGDARHAGDGDGDGEGEGDLIPPVSPSAPNPPEQTREARLTEKTGDSPDDCAKAIRELIADAVPLDRIDRRIDAMTEPIGVWVWKRAVLAGWKSDKPKRSEPGPLPPVHDPAVAAKRRVDAVRAASDLAAFQASGFKTRREYLASKRATA